MTMQTTIDLRARRAELLSESERISDAIDKMPTEQLHRQLREVTAEIDRIDRRIEEARRSR
jgi:hypothetical protein